MQKRLFSLLAGAAVVVMACQPTASVAPSGTAAAPSASPSEPAVSPSGSPSGSPGAFDESVLFGYDYTPEPGTPGGNAVISDWQTPVQLNPYFSNAFKNTRVFAMTLRPLIAISSSGHWIPDLLKKVPRFSDNSIRRDASGEGFEIDLELKEGLLWSDGTPLTLEDWKYTWEWVNDDAQVGLSAGTTGWDLVDRIDVTDGGLKATMHYTSGYAGYYGILNEELLPQHYMSTIPVADAATQSYPISAALESTVVSGPFKYGAATADTIELVRNDNWRGCLGETCTTHPAYLDRITYKSYSDNKDAMIAAFLNGDLDLAADLLQGDYAAIQGVNPEIGTAEIKPAWEYEHLDFNQAGGGPGSGHPALTEVEVRQAINHAINKDLLYETVYPGTPKPNLANCTNAPEADGIYWRLENPNCLTFDLARANALLDEAGWTDSNSDGTRDKDGVELVLQHCSTPAPFRVAGGDAIASMLQQVGITMERTYDAVVFDGWADTTPETQCNLVRGTFDTAEYAYVLTFDIFGDYYFSYHSSQIPTEANSGEGSNNIKINNPEMDAALDALYLEIDPGAQVELAKQLQELYVAQTFEVTLYDRSAVLGVGARLGGLEQNVSTQSDQWNAEDWFIKQ